MQLPLACQLQRSAAAVLVDGGAAILVCRSSVLRQYALGEDGPLGFYRGPFVLGVDDVE